MRKMKLVMLTVAFTAFASLTAFAVDQGWVKEDNAWYYLDKDGDAVENAWKTNADGTLYFYLNEDGEMATSSLIEDGEYLYYVNADGVQTRNQWRLIEDEDTDEEARWYYFDAKGRAIKNSKKVIDGKTYYFDAEGKMLYGWATIGTDSNAVMVDNYTTGTMYLGTNETGWRWDSQWFKETDLEDEDADYFWFRFNSKGQKVEATNAGTFEKVRIDGVEYMFDENGVMASDRFVSIGEDTYFVSKSGEIYKNRWFWFENADTEDGHWYFADKNGKLIKDGEKKINGKTYLFDNFKMTTGFVASGSNTSFVEDLLETKSTEFEGTYAYYTENGDKVTDKSIELELEDGFFVFRFDKNGNPYVDKTGKYCYVNGILQRAVDAKYAILADGKIVNTSGKIMTGTKYTIDDVVYEKQADGTYKAN